MTLWLLILAKFARLLEFDIVYSPTTKSAGKPVSVRYLNDCGISFEDCKTLEDYEMAIEMHDCFSVKVLLNE